MKDEVYDFLCNFGCSYVHQEENLERLYYYYQHPVVGLKQATAFADVFAIWHGFKIWVEVGEINSKEKIEALEKWENDSRNIFVWIQYGDNVKDAIEELRDLLKNIPKSSYREIPPPKPMVEFFDLNEFKEFDIDKIRKIAENHHIRIFYEEGVVRASEINSFYLEKVKKVRKELEKKYGYDYSTEPYTCPVEFWKNHIGNIVSVGDLPDLFREMERHLDDFVERWKSKKYKKYGLKRTQSM